MLMCCGVINLLNLFAKGFEHKDESATLLTAFEVFEHLVDPVEVLDYMLTIAPNILLSTEIMPMPTPSQGACGILAARTTRWILSPENPTVYGGTLWLPTADRWTQLSPDHT